MSSGADHAEGSGPHEDPDAVLAERQEAGPTAAEPQLVAHIVQGEEGMDSCEYRVVLDLAEAAPTAPRAVPRRIEGAQAVLLLGLTGSGIEEQGDVVADALGGKLLRLADVVRKEIATGSVEGIELDMITREGGIFSTHLLVTVLWKAMEGTRGPHVLLGFPRTEANLAALESTVCELSGVVYCAPDDEILLKRMVEDGLVSFDTISIPLCIYLCVYLSMYLSSLFIDLSVYLAVYLSIDMIYVYTCMHTYMYLYMCVCVCIYIYLFICIFIYILLIYMYICMYIHIYF